MIGNTTHQAGRVAIRGLGARTCSPNHQALFWENPRDPTLIAYEFRLLVPSGVHSRWHSLAIEHLPCRDWEIHSVLIYHNLQNPWDLTFELRGVNAERHGDPAASIHLAAVYEVEYPKAMWQSQAPGGNRPYLAVGIEGDNGESPESMQDISASIYRLSMKGDQSWEEALSRTTGRGARLRREGESWVEPPANLRRRSFDYLHPSSLPSKSHSPEHILGGTLKTREWDLRVHAEDSERVWFIVRDAQTWERGYELSRLPLHEVPNVAFPYDS